MEESLEFQHNGYTISTDKSRLDVNMVHEFLSQRSYWAPGRSRDRVEISIQNSLCFGLYDPDGLQVGFARLVTDYATFAWLCDVFVLEQARDQGLGKWLVDCITRQTEWADQCLFLLKTNNAHELYRRYGGFDRLSLPEKWMERPRRL